MNEQPQPTTEQIHNNLKNLLLNGRILVNGLPLTANEIATVIQGEQMLFEKAMKFDQASALAAKKKIEEEAKKQAAEHKETFMEIPGVTSKKLELSQTYVDEKKQAEEESKKK